MQITIRHDDSSPNVREDCDHLGTMACFHNRYRLGDKHNFASGKAIAWSWLNDLDETGIEAVAAEMGPDFERGEDVLDSLLYVHPDDVPDAALEAVARHWPGVALTLYLYDHSGVTMRTAPFTDPWDSGPVGIIFAGPKAIRENFLLGDDGEITPELIERTKSVLEAEVKEYDHQLRGNVWGYVITDDNGDDTDDSCWGFIGDDIEECGMLDHIPDYAHDAAIEAFENRFDGTPVEFTHPNAELVSKTGPCGAD